jgi:hypothetical protein
MDRLDSIQDQDAAEVIYLMLDGTGFETGRPELSVPALQAQAACPTDISSDSRQALTSLSTDLHPDRHLQDARVDEEEQTVGRRHRGMSGDVHNRHL